MQGTETEGPGAAHYPVDGLKLVGAPRCWCWWKQFSETDPKFYNMSDPKTERSCFLGQITKEQHAPGNGGHFTFLQT